MTGTPGELDDFFAALASEGTTEARSVGFTLESTKARDKLREFALSHPESYQLLMVAGLYALGSRKFTVQLDADDLTVTGDHPIERHPFVDLWSYASRGSTEASVIGYRLIAIALLTSVRFEQMLWTIESSDSQGEWGCEFQVRGGEVSDGAITSRDALNVGVRLSSKRRALGQIARRYIGRLIRQVQGLEQREESLLAERLFLPRGGSLEINGKRIRREHDTLAVSSVLASLNSGEAPDLVPASSVFHLKKDDAVCVLLTNPELPEDASVPGAGNRVHWIWNGLLMDSTILGSGLESFRAFVWAPLLRPDLSFTSLVDNRDKQALERSVRDMARELLKLFVVELSERIQERGLSEPQQWEGSLSIVRSALLARIDLARDRNRLASLNRALIACPLCLGSDAQGEERWITFGEIWQRLQNKETVAIFASAEHWREIPAWAGRPLVLRTTEVEAVFFKKVFRAYKFADAKTVAAQILRMLQRASGSFVEDVSAIKVAKEPAALSGTARLDGRAIEWEFSAQVVSEALAGGSTKCESGLRVTQAGRTFFVDRTLKLPPGMSLTAEAPWQPNYQERLEDRELATRISLAVIESAAQTLAQRPVPVTDHDIAITSLLLRGLAKLGLGFRDSESFDWQDIAWLCVADLNGVRDKTSPRALKARCAQLHSPLYYAECQELHRSNLPVPYAWKELPIVLIAPSAGDTLKLLDTQAESWQGIKKLLSRAYPDGNEEAFVWRGVLEGNQACWISNDLSSVALEIPRGSWSAQDKTHLFRSVVMESLHGHYLQSKNVDLPISPSLVAVDWQTGWPDGLGLQRRTTAAPTQSQEQLAKACRHLAASFLSSAAPEVILAAHPQTVGSALFETLSEPLTSQACVLLLSNGRKVRMTEVPALEGVARYFSQAEDFGHVPDHAVYAPGPMNDALSLLSDLRWLEVSSMSEILKPAQAGPFRLPKSAEEPQVASQPPPSPVLARLPAKKAGGIEAAALASAKAPKPTPSPIQAPQLLSRTQPVKESHPIQAPKLLRRAQTPQNEDIASVKAFAARGDGTGSKLGADLPVPKLDRSVPAPLTKEQQSLVDEFLSFSGSDPDDEFLEFLSRVTIDDTASELLREKGGSFSLGRRAVQAASSQDGRLALLSALFSVFNRQREDVSDADERAFHARLLRRSLELERERW